MREQHALHDLLQIRAARYPQPYAWRVVTSKYSYKVYIKSYIKKPVKANIIKELKKKLIIKEDYSLLSL